jgi:colicin import membrane protein
MEVQESALAVIESFTGVQLFKPGAMDDILSRIEAEVRSTPKDISTPKGRDAIKSLAHKVARSKTFIEDQRLALVSDEKKRLAAIDAEGKKMRDRLDALKVEARAPLTAWENEEKERTAKHEENIAAMELAGTLDFGASIEEIKERIAVVELVDPSTFQEFKDRATQTKTAVLSGLETKLKIAEKQAADALEMLTTARGSRRAGQA